MYYIAHGTFKQTETVNSKQIVEINDYYFDAKKYNWIILPKSNGAESVLLKENVLTQEWFENNCHPNGVFKCPRCYRKHYIVDNFNLLCDGCVKTLREYHSDGFSFPFTDDFNLWYTNIPQERIDSRIALRNALDAAYKAEHLMFNDKPIVIVRDPLTNDGKLECSFTDDLKERFFVNVFDMVIV